MQRLTISECVSSSISVGPLAEEVEVERSSGDIGHTSGELSS